MKYMEAGIEDCERIYALVQETIKTVYPKYYPREVVDFFKNLHSMDGIRQDIEDRTVTLLYEKEMLIGTGTCKGNHITRVFVPPAYQRQGYGGQIMQYLEEKAAAQYHTVCLDASLPACQFYERRGYVTLRHETVDCENDVVLVYGMMEKRLAGEEKQVLSGTNEVLW